MKKIKSLFERDYEGNRQVIDKVVEGSEWVQRGEGIATRKWDGTSCLIKGDILYKRYDVKKGRSVPEGAIPCEPAPNEHTGHWPHWVECDRNNPADKYFFEAFDVDVYLQDGTYELCGPKVNGNKDDWSSHVLAKHGSVEFKPSPPTSFNELKEWLSENEIEGIVWHHPDGRMVKIKRKDFGLKW